MLHLRLRGRRAQPPARAHHRRTQRVPGKFAATKKTYYRGQIACKSVAQLVKLYLFRATSKSSPPFQEGPEIGGEILLRCLVPDCGFSAVCRHRTECRAASYKHYRQRHLVSFIYSIHQRVVVKGNSITGQAGEGLQVRGARVRLRERAERALQAAHAAPQRRVLARVPHLLKGEIHVLHPHVGSGRMVFS